MSVLFYSVFLVCFNSVIPSVWIEVGHNLSKDVASERVKLLSPIPGNAVRSALLITPEDESETKGFSVMYGPYKSASDALNDVIALLFKYPSFKDLRLSKLDGSPVKIRIPHSARRKLKLPGTKYPFPQKGISLTLRTLCFKAPYYGIPNASAFVASLGYRDELWLLKEKSVCNANKCRRWFLGITPAPYNLVWVPAGQVVPVSRIKSVRDANGKILKYTAVLWTSKDGRKYSYMAVRFMGNRTPYKTFFTLKRLFYLKLKKDEADNWLAYDRRGVPQYKLPKYPDWRPVSALYKSSSRRLFFEK